MKQQLLLIRYAVLFTMLLIAQPASECFGQRNASTKFEKETFGKTRKGKAPEGSTKARGAAGKAMKEQEKKEEARDREDEKGMKELKDRHYNMQSEATKERMANNGEKTEADFKAKKQQQKQQQKQYKDNKKRLTDDEKKMQANYKAKKQKQRKEQQKPKKKQIRKP